MWLLKVFLDGSACRNITLKGILWLRSHQLSFGYNGIFIFISENKYQLIEHAWYLIKIMLLREVVARKMVQAIISLKIPQMFAVLIIIIDSFLMVAQPNSEEIFCKLKYKWTEPKVLTYLWSQGPFRFSHPIFAAKFAKCLFMLLSLSLFFCNLKLAGSRRCVCLLRFFSRKFRLVHIVTSGIFARLDVKSSH